MRRSFLRRFAPWTPPARGDGQKVTVPPLPAVELGGRGGCSVSYSENFSKTPYWKRMALSNYELRMKENRTTYPLSQVNEGEFDRRYLPAPYPDPLVHRPTSIVGEPCRPRRVDVPVIFLKDVVRPESEGGSYVGRKHETRYVHFDVMRNELAPLRLAMYATPENYRLLGLPVCDHHIHEELVRSHEDYEKLRAKQKWDEEPWRFSFEFLFRKYEAGPPELLDEEPISFDTSEAEQAGEASVAGGAGGKRLGTKRKAKKVRLFDTTAAAAA